MGQSFFIVSLLIEFDKKSDAMQFNEKMKKSTLGGYFESVLIEYSKDC